jgi:hypothetical protein
MPAAVFETVEYRVGLSVDGWFPQDELLDLLRWCEAKLTAPGGGPAVVSPLDEELILAVRGKNPLIVHGRARMLNMVRSLQYQGRFNGWRYAGSKMWPSGSGVDVDVVGPEGMGVRLTIEVSAVDGRSKVDADFDLLAHTEPEAAKAAVEANVETLQTAERTRINRRSRGVHRA